eukprot:4265006-Lingulodinium_polyedra.AAC.1
MTGHLPVRGARRRVGVDDGGEPPPDSLKALQGRHVDLIEGPAQVQHVGEDDQLVVDPVRLLDLA